MGLRQKLRSLHEPEWICHAVLPWTTTGTAHRTVLAVYLYIRNSPVLRCYGATVRRLAGRCTIPCPAQIIFGGRPYKVRSKGRGRPFIMLRENGKPTRKCLHEIGPHPLEAPEETLTAPAQPTPAEPTGIARLIQQKRDREAAQRAQADELAAIYASGSDPLELG